MFYATYTGSQDLSQIFKHYIQLNQMSKMSNSRSRAQYITLKLIPLNSAPLNWGRRQKFLLLSSNVFFWGSFFEYGE